MKTLKSGWNVVEIPIYQGTIWIKLSDDYTRDGKAINYNIDPHYNDHLGISFVKEKGTWDYVILIKKASPSIIAHEALHITNFILKDRGVVPDFDNDEPQAYLLGWIVEQVYKAVNH